MIGRQDELEWTTRTLAAPGAVCQLVGPPGIGKSTVARSWVAERDSVWIALEPASPGSLLAVLAGTLDTPATFDAVAGALQGVDTAVLDGAEAHEDEVIELLAALRERRGTTRILVTTQRRMAIGPVLEVGPLPLDEGVALFMERARQVSALAFEEADASIEELVRRLEGWPLAVELAASRVRLFSPEELLEEEPLDVLADRNRGGRHASLQTALHGTWALLSEDDRQALSRIALVCGWFGRKGFEAVTGCRLDALERLMDASLVRWVAVPKGRRYALLGPVRTFALEQLAPDDAARARYAEVVLARADDARVASRGSGGAAAYTELRELQTDLVHHLDSTPENAARSARALVTLALAHGPIPQALVWAETALARDGIPQALRQSLEELRAELLIQLHRFDDALSVLDGLPTTPDTRFLRGWAMRESDLPGAIEEFRRAITIADDEGGPYEQARARLSLGVALRRSGDLTGAQAAYRNGLEIARRSRVPRIEAVFLANLALMDADLQGFGPELRKQLERAVGLIREAGFQRLEVQIIGLLAQSDTDTQHPDAVASIDALIELSRHVGSTRMVQNGWMLRALVAIEAEDSAAAEHAMAEVGVPIGARNEAMFNVLLAMQCALARDPDSAADRLARARQRFEDAGLPNEVVMMDIQLAVARREAPPPLDDERWPPGSPIHVAHEIATAAFENRAIPQGLLDATRRSFDCRFVLALSRGAVRVEVGTDGTWFRTSSGRVELGRKRVLRRVLKAFADRQGEWITLEQLLADGWPGERTTGDSGRARVHVAVSELRKLGLRDAIVTSPDHVAAYCLHAVVRD